MQIHIDPHTAVPYAVILVMLVAVLGRAVSSKKAVIERLWISPVFLVVAAAALVELSAASLGPLTLVALAAAFVVGAAVGWRRGRLTPVEIDPDARALASPVSPGGVMLVVALFLVRYFIHSLAVYEPKALLGGGPDEIGLILDGLAMFVVGMVAAGQFELWIRCRRLLAETPA